MSKDTLIFDLIEEEKNRQIEGIELIASRNGYYMINNLENMLRT